MISIKSKEDIKEIKRSGAIASFALKQIIKNLRPGVTTFELDKLARRTIRARGAEPSFLGYKGYEHAVCISINDEVVHGLPSSRTIEKGDVVGIDIGVNLNGYYSDLATTCVIGHQDENISRLVVGTKEALFETIKMIKPGVKVGDIESKTGEILKKYKLDPITALSGHGVGYSVHEEPSIKSDGVSGTGPVIKEGMVLAIEPMSCLGSSRVHTLSDGWTVVTDDGSVSAHFEHTVEVGKMGVKILTQ